MSEPSPSAADTEQRPTSILAVYAWDSLLALFAILGALLPTTGATHASAAAFEQAFTSGLHTALIVAGAVALAGATVAAAFIQTTANQKPQTDPP